MIQREAFEGGCSFSDKWKLLGVTKKWNRNSLDVKFDEIWEDPGRMRSGYVYDLDHGTTRMWGGRYNGKLPRVEYACRVEL